MINIEQVVANPHGVPIEPLAQRLVTLISLSQQVDSNTIADVMSYIERLRYVDQFTFMRLTINTNPTLLNTQTMGDWCIKNATKLAACEGW